MSSLTSYITFLTALPSGCPTKGSEYTARAVTEPKKSKPKNDRTRIEQEIFKIDKRLRHRKSQLSCGAPPSKS